MRSFCLCGALEIFPSAISSLLNCNLFLAGLLLDRLSDFKLFLCFGVCLFSESGVKGGEGREMGTRRGQGFGDG